MPSNTIKEVLFASFFFSNSTRMVPSKVSWTRLMSCHRRKTQPLAFDAISTSIPGLPLFNPYKLPTDINTSGNWNADLSEVHRGVNEVRNDDVIVGLTLWILPCGGFALADFRGGGGMWRSSWYLVVVYTEMDVG
ncbi:unnamed protein product [Fraxinus pennsylvanica]|uniref:DUF1117 domain-containing protein n=1 Tax=Fraxinus pennsylvanica TaxID=56036 RepID=A0AAD2EAI9_9LAMI|nr:unnamed protein product [Fraxinus pennsylvanica]